MSEEQRRKNSPNIMNLAKLVISHGAQERHTLQLTLRALAAQRKPPREHPSGVASHVQGDEEGV